MSTCLCASMWLFGECVDMWYLDDCDIICLREITIAWNDSDDWYWIWWHDAVSRVWVDVMMLYPMTGWADTMLYPVSAGHDAVSRVWLWFRRDGVFHVWFYCAWHDAVSHARLTWCCFPCLVWHDVVSHARVLYSILYVDFCAYVFTWHHCIA